MKKTIIALLLSVFLLVSLSSPVLAADRENFSVGKLTVLKKMLGAAVESVSKAMTAGVDWTLSKIEALATFLTVTGSGSSDSIIVPTAYLRTGDIKIVRNETDGGVYIKAYGETGFEIATGKTAIAIYNGTDYVRITADATH